MKERIVRMSGIIFFIVFIASCAQNKDEKVHKLLMSARQNIHNNLPDAALSDLEKAEKLDKNNPEIYFLRGNIHMTSNDYNSAMLDYNQAILLNENYTEAYLNRGRLWFYLGEEDKKCADYLKAESLGAKNLYEVTKFCR
jgi:tetratricopeptide (TPR) repeat protein